MGKRHCGWQRALSEPIQALVTDVVMPQMSGPVLAERLRHGLAWPPGALHVGLYRPSGRQPLNEPGAAFIQKPFLPDALSKQLRDLLDQSIQRGQDSRI